MGNGQWVIVASGRHTRKGPAVHHSLFMVEYPTCAARRSTLLDRLWSTTGYGRRPVSLAESPCGNPATRGTIHRQRLQLPVLLAGRIDALGSLSASEWLAFLERCQIFLIALGCSCAARRRIIHRLLRLRLLCFGLLGLRLLAVWIPFRGANYPTQGQSQGASGHHRKQLAHHLSPLYFHLTCIRVTREAEVKKTTTLISPVHDGLVPGNRVSVRGQVSSSGLRAMTPHTPICCVTWDYSGVHWATVSVSI